MPLTLTFQTAWVESRRNRDPSRRATGPAEGGRRLSRKKSSFGFVLIALLPLLLCFTTGCETKSRARFQARQAYVEGQQQALEQSGPKPKIVTVTGQVRNSIIPWTEELTLAKAIVAADYTGYLNPRLIRLIRDGIPTDIKASALLNGQDMPLQPGDTIQVVP